ncbi:MAG TPA: HAMP domain-containing sensor histidine kinase, partial [Segetibacter sp.]
RNNAAIAITDVNVCELINASCKSLSCDIEDSCCTINIKCEVVHVSANKTYLESIFLNLLNNAIKYRASERPLQIDIATHMNAAGEIILTVKDNGLGIDLDTHRNNVFGLYQRFHTNKNGIGLGLFIVKSQILSLGGTIEIDSEVDKGTTFTIAFPQAKATRLN